MVFHFQTCSEVIKKKKKKKKQPDIHSVLVVLIIWKLWKGGNVNVYFSSDMVKYHFPA